MKIYFYQDGMLLYSREEWAAKGIENRGRELVNNIQPWIEKNTDEILRVQKELQEAQKCIQRLPLTDSGELRLTVINHDWRFERELYVETTCSNPKCPGIAGKLSESVHFHRFYIGGIKILSNEIRLIVTSGEREVITVILNN